MPKELKISAEASNGAAVIRIDGPISMWSNYASWFKSQLDAIISQGVKDATIYLNTPGGDCFEANEIRNEIKRFTGRKTASLGAMCASAGTAIACACDEVIAAANTQYMIHKPIGYFEGNSDEVKAQIKLLDNLQNDYLQMYVNKTGLTADKISAMWVEDYWMNAAEAKSLGFIDKVEGQDAPVTEDQVTALSEFGYKNAPRMIANFKPQDNMSKLVMIALGLSEQSTEVQMVASIEALKTKAGQADAYKQKAEEFEAAAKKAKVTAAMDKHRAAKKFTAETEGFWEKQLTDNFDETNATLDKMPGAVQLSNTITNQTTGTGAGEDRSKWTYADYQAKNPKALAALPEDEFARLFEAEYGKKP